MRRALTSLMLGLMVVGCDKAPAPQPEPAPVASSAAAEPAAPKVYEHTMLSRVYEVDRIYRSMQGPSSLQDVELGKTLAGSKERELLWIVGFEALMVEPEGKDEVSQEFMCHTNLDIDPSAHTKAFEDDKRITGRLFTLSQGQYRIDLPEGFGIPVISDEILSLNTQVLNLNMKEGKRQVRHKVVMRFVRDREVVRPMQALFVAGVYGMKLLEGKDGVYGAEAPVPNPAHDEHGDGHHGKGHHGNGECLPGQAASNNEFGDGKGRTFTGHWIVKPGHETNHTRVTDILDLPYDTTIHYVAVHLHPFAETLELRDMTTGQSVYKANARQVDEGIGLAHVDFFSSPAGLPLIKGHEYEVVSHYNNTSGEDQDSMAVLNLYVLDKAFKKPDLSKPREPEETGEEAPPTPSAIPSTRAKAGGKMM